MFYFKHSIKHYPFTKFQSAVCLQITRDYTVRNKIAECNGAEAVYFIIFIIIIF